MRILSRRFLASYLGMLAACVGGLLLALAVVDMLVDFDAAVEGGVAGLVVLLRRVPARWLREALPLASFAAAFLAVALPARRGEILAVRAGGIHPARATLPIAAAALAVGAAASWLPAEPSAEAAFFDPARGAAGAAVWRHAGDRVTRIGRLDARSGGLRDVCVFEIDPAFRLRRRLRAAEGRVAAGGLALRDAEVLRLDPAVPAAAPRVEVARVWRAAALDRTQAAPEAPGEPRGDRPIADRASAPASVAVLALLALPLGLRVSPAGGLAAPALAALAQAALFRGAWQAAGFAAERSPLAAAWVPGLVWATFAAAAIWLWARAPR